MFAGDICNTNVYEPGDISASQEARTMIEEQVGWAVEAGVDFIIGETFSYAEEALIGLEVIKEAGLPAVITLAVHRDPETREGWSVAEACKRLEDAGADVVGLNCIRGPMTMMPLLKEIVCAVDVPVAALPVPYRTHEEEPSFQSLRDPHYDGYLPSGIPFPTALDPFYCNRYEISAFTREAWALGVSYFGLCCGAAPHHIRSMAEALGRMPPASRYSEDMSKHVFLGTDPTLRRQNIEYRSEL
ncbi:MAG: homocysteine S-methyltransferase family protein [Actinomycetota bacterium]|nr:homocysteine S-methyltransferase family protein [Actinomycetota bacterium]